jgi:broad specificity phosphatase PhoE
MSLEIVVETHATSTDNEAGIATGWLPGELSATGRRQAAELGSRHRGGTGLTAVLSSDLRRAVQTAQLAFPHGTPPLRQDPRLRECDYGRLNGAPAADIAAARVHHLDLPFPGGGQSYRQVRDATRALLHDLWAEWDHGARLLIVTHSANRWAFASLLGGADLADLLRDPPPWQPGWRYVLNRPPALGTPGIA